MSRCTATDNQSLHRDPGFDFARAVAAVGIVVFHFYCHSDSARKLFLYHANGSWGTTLNYLFFALSGYLLQMKYGQPGNLHLQTFYYKRWKATIPAHLAVFLFAFCMNVFSLGKLFYLDIPKWQLLLSFVGMDGYATLIAPTYFITGEWFLGAILMAYIVYPLLRWIAGLRWIRYVFLGGLLGLYALLFQIDVGPLSPSINPITCLLSFYVGMLGAEHSGILKINWVAAVSLILCVVLFAIPMGGETVTKMTLAGWCLVIVLYRIGCILCKNPIISRITLTLSALSYPVFLIHHRIILKVLTGFNSTSTLRSLVALALSLFSTLILAAVLDHLMKSLFKSKPYMHFERFFLKDKKE